MDREQAEMAPTPTSARGGLRARITALFASPLDPFTADRLEITGRVEKTALVALAALVCLLPFRSDVTWVDYSLYPGIAALLGLMYVLRSRWPELAGLLGGVGFIALVTAAAWFREGFASGVTSSAYALAVVVGGLLWGPGRTLLLAVIASVAAGALLRYAPHPAQAPLRSWGEVTAVLVTLALFVELALGALSARTTEAQNTRHRFAQLFDASPDALILVNAGAEVQLLNQAARQLLGRPVSVGDALSSFEPFAGDNARALESVLNGETTSLPPSSRNPGIGEKLRSFAEGRFHEFLITQLSESPADHSQLWLLTIRDVTERVRAARAHHQFEAQSSNSKSLESLGRLAGGVAHDFNNLLTVILGTTDLVIATSRLDERARENLRSVQSAAERAAELTGQLLAFGRKQVLEPTVFCPNTSLVHLRPLFERLIPESIAFRVDAATDLGRARIDPARLEQVLVNLVTNACDAMPSGGTLHIETSNRSVTEGRRLPVGTSAGEALPAGDYICIQVADTGSGMDSETLAQIFEPFFTTKEIGKGTGLGLATVFGVVRQSGGYIRVHSGVGEGTRFELFFPRVSDEATQHEVRSDRALMRVLPALTVLLVEDSPSVRSSVRAMLEALGHAVVEAGNGHEAWSVIEQRSTGFDLLLTDVVMPNMNGIELASVLRERYPAAKVLFMTGYSQGTFNDSDARPDVLLGEGSAYLPKPFTTRLLEAKLAEVFGEPSVAAPSSGSNRGAGAQ